MTVARRLLLNWKIIESAPESDESNQVIIAGNLEEFGEVSGLIRKANKSERILGRIGADAPADSKAIGKFNDLEEILSLYPINEIIFWEGELSFKKIIETIPRVPHHVRVKFFAKGSHTIIWSDDKNATGDFILKENFRLGEEACRRTKNVSDVIVSFLFILFFPFFLILKRRPLLFFKNVLDVLLRKKTWVGYATDEKDLPGLKPGIITTTGLPATLNSLPKESLLITDKLYAKQYHLMNDIKLVWKNYRWLS